jgi:hypothetical protein
MSHSLKRTDVLMEVEKLPRPGDQPGKAVKKVHLPPEMSMEQAKKEVGKTVEYAIGADPRKQYGPDNVISGVVSGDVPAYLARLYQNDGARRRLAKAWLKGASGVRTRNVTVIEWDEEEAV